MSFPELILIAVGFVVNLLHIHLLYKNTGVTINMAQSIFETRELKFVQMKARALLKCEMNRK